jgi:hypothetical protein
MESTKSPPKKNSKEKSKKKKIILNKFHNKISEKIIKEKKNLNKIK